MNVAQNLRQSVSLSAVLAILSLGILGILTTFVVNLGRVLGYTNAASLLTEDEIATLQILKIINGSLLVIPIAIFIMCAGDVGKTAAELYVAPQKVIAKGVAKSASGASGPVKKRPIIFGTLFIVLAGAIIGDFVATALAFKNLAEKTIPSDFPINLDKIETLRLVALYSIIAPGLVVVFSLALIFKAIHDKKSTQT
jgi:hypothetical protein